MNPADLTDIQWATVRDILMVYAPRYDRAAVFGSRATGRHRRGSDLDLVIYAADAALCDELSGKFFFSDLSIEVDVVDYDRLSNAALKAEIDRCSVTLPVESQVAR